jgi:hypothetical protein
MQREDGGPRLEKQKHAAAEFRIRESILRRERGESWDYEGRAEDLELIRRKRHESGPERIRRVVGYGQEDTAKGRGGGTVTDVHLHRT